MESADSCNALPLHLEMAVRSPLKKMLMSGEMSAEVPASPNRREELDRWFVVMSSRYSLVALATCMHALVFMSGLVYYDTDAILVTPTSDVSRPLSFAHAAALVLHCDVAILLFPVCRTLISFLRGSPFHLFTRKGSGISFHVLASWYMVVFAWVHTVAYWVKYGHEASKNKQGFKAFLLLNFSTGPGLSGHIMLLTITIIAATSTGYARTAKWGTFCAFHHLYILLFVLWAIHGAFAMKHTSETAPWMKVATFWQYWIYGGTAFLLEKVLREIRSRHKSHISKVIRHPSNVVEIQMKKRKIAVKVGQVVYICCPEVSIIQSRAFVLTSAPEEDYLSVHIHCSDRFTKTLAAAIGCRFPDSIEQNTESDSSVVGIDETAIKLDVDPTIQNPLPPVSIDGPFGHTPGSLWEKDVAVLVAVGSSVVVFASILKSIWYRMNYAYEATALRKVYFFWLCDDIIGFEWFKSLLVAIEAQSLDDNIEVHPYLTNSYERNITAPAKAFKSNEDIFAGLRLSTSFGPPNWDTTLEAIEKLDGPCNLGIFPCNSPDLCWSWQTGIENLEYHV